MLGRGKLSKGWITALIGVGIVATILAALSALWEVRQRQATVERMLEENAAVVTAVVGNAASHSSRAYNELESEMARRMESVLELVAQMDDGSEAADILLRRFAGFAGVMTLETLDAEGNPIPNPIFSRDRIARGRPWRAQRDDGDSERPDDETRFDDDGRPPRFQRRDWELFARDNPEIGRVLSGEADSARLGFHRRRGPGPNQTYGAVRRRADGGAFVAVIPAEEIARLKAAASQAALLEQVKNTPGILDVRWTPLDRKVPSSFRTAWADTEAGSGFVGVRTVNDTPTSSAEIRVFLDAQPVKAIQSQLWQQGLRRVGFVTLALLAATGLLFARQNIRLLVEERDRIQEDVRRLEEESRRKEKLTAMGELAAGVAHEIRNPLNAMSMASQRLEREFEPTSDAAEYGELLDTIRSESGRVEQVIEQFLRFARPAKVEPTDGDLARLTRDVARNMRPMAAASGIMLEVEAPTALPYRFDLMQMTQALENLVRNAVEAQPNGGEIRVELETRDTTVRLRVSDKGDGIPSEEAQRVFDLYYTTKPNGNGLGLPTVHQIVAEHGGRVELSSDVGKGATVEMILPA